LYSLKRKKGKVEQLPISSRTSLIELEDSMDQREKDRLLWNLKSLPNELHDLLRDLDEGTLRLRPIPNKWSIKEIMCHLRDMERLAYLARYRRMLSEDNPLLPNVDQDRLAFESDYINQDAKMALDEFKRLRWETLQTLHNAPLESWSRTGRHETDGPMSVEQLVVRQIKGNDMNHLVQMKDIVRLKMPW
jgi:DinB family protein